MSRVGLSVITTAFVLVGSTATAQDGYRIIVNTANPVSSVSKAQISKLFLEKAAWDDGVAATPVDLLPNSAIRDSFSRDVLGASPAAVAERWSKTPGGAAPPAVASDREVLAFVRLKPGAIGYVSLDADVQGVKVVAVGGKGGFSAVSSSGQGPLTVGGRVPMPERIVHTQPNYPLIAKNARVQGTVGIEIVISPAGDVTAAKVVSSIPVLDEEAVKAVKQWKYKPTIVNGAAVPVTMVVRVNFAL